MPRRKLSRAVGAARPPWRHLTHVRSRCRRRPRMERGRARKGWIWERTGCHIQEASRPASMRMQKEHSPPAYPCRKCNGLLSPRRPPCRRRPRRPRNRTRRFLATCATPSHCTRAARMGKNARCARCRQARPCGPPSSPCMRVRPERHALGPQTRTWRRVYSTAGALRVATATFRRHWGSPSRNSIAIEARRRRFLETCRLTACPGGTSSSAARSLKSNVAPPCAAPEYSYPLQSLQRVVPNKPILPNHAC
mmetsp:Transcript_57725/g.160925  ORF Transcript_57725/g.160925 Transcript_57725/m.160925 type:complete len:251 (-) Transcript_57725:235-987(-)